MLTRSNSSLRGAALLARFLVAIPAAAVAACAAAPPPPSVSANDPSNPDAVETPAPPAIVTAAVVDAGTTPAAAVYACPMHPEVTSTQPGQKCPKCGMTLVPRKAAQ